MNAQDNQPDWPDALIDRGLAELVGGETPPDLSERIFAAAQANSLRTPSLWQKDHSSHEPPPSSNLRVLKPWASSRLL